MAGVRRRAAGALAVAALACLAACGTSAPATPRAVVSPPPAVAGGGPPVPARGAYVGAYVQPQGGQVGTLAAVAAYESSLGRQLDIVHTYHRWTVPFPDAAERALAASGRYLLLSWASVPLVAITDGSQDAVIRARAQALAAWGVPVFLEWRWEMDRPNLASVVGRPSAYVAAWDHIRAIFTQVGVHTVSWVWCPTATGFADGRAAAYYPGDAQVDWVCADAYTTSPQQQIGMGDQPLSALVGPALAFAQAHHKPLMVGEFGTAYRGDDSQAAWVTASFAWAATQPYVKALVYFDETAPGPSGVSTPVSLRSSPVSMAALGAALATPHFNPRSHPTVGS